MIPLNNYSGGAFLGLGTDRRHAVEVRLKLQCWYMYQCPRRMIYAGTILSALCSGTYEAAEPLCVVPLCAGGSMCSDCVVCSYYEAYGTSWVLTRTLSRLARRTDELTRTLTVISGPR
jgi:hypothetical protein